MIKDFCEVQVAVIYDCVILSIELRYMSRALRNCTWLRYSMLFEGGMTYIDYWGIDARGWKKRTCIISIEALLYPLIGGQTTSDIMTLASVLTMK